jgi:hypothetical protein
VPISALGGTIQVQCSGTTVTVLSVQPAAGYTIKDDDRGPAAAVQVVLLSEVNESEIKVKCGASGPRPTVKESPQ